MLGRLLKYELPSIGRLLLPLYLVWMASAVLLMISVSSDITNSVLVIETIIYAALLAAIFVVMLIMIILRFKNSCLGDEAYFNLALPVSNTTQLFSKLISAVIWIVATILVAVITILISVILMNVAYDPWFLQWFRADGPTVLLLLELFVVIVISIASFVLRIYAAMCIGYQAPNSKILASIGVYIGLSLIEYILDKGLEKLFSLRIDEAVLLSNWNQVAAEMGEIMLFTLLPELLFAVIYFLLCKYMMDKHLNLS